jgi:hypothetical protein
MQSTGQERNAPHSYEHADMLSYFVIIICPKNRLPPLLLRPLQFTNILSLEVKVLYSTPPMSEPQILHPTARHYITYAVEYTIR